MKENIKIFAVLFQPILIVLFFCYAIAPIYFGKDVIIATSGYDPRDYFRGDYVDLRYDFNDMTGGINDDEKFSVVYALLDEKDGIYYTKSVSKTKPKDGLYIRGFLYDYSSKFGVESYFLPTKQAQNLESELMDVNTTTYANLKILNGEARIVGLKTKKL